MPVYGRRILRVKQKNKCFFCKNELPEEPRLCVIHHINGDHSDNRMDNRCLVHSTCHIRHHKGLLDKLI